LPNIIVELQQEMARVRALLPRLDANRRKEAEGTIEFARVYMTLNSLDGMRESLNDLREFLAPKKNV
jgi:hypothetical protein